MRMAYSTLKLYITSETISEILNDLRNYLLGSPFSAFVRLAYSARCCITSLRLCKASASSLRIELNLAEHKHLGLGPRVCIADNLQFVEGF